jgi:hypothetical protein
MSYSVTASEPVFAGHAFKVRIDTVRRPDGKQHKIEIVDHPGAVTLVPVDADGRLHFVRQYRHSTLEEMLELPAGTLDPGEERRPAPARVPGRDRHGAREARASRWSSWPPAIRPNTSLCFLRPD